MRLPALLLIPLASVADSTRSTDETSSDAASPAAFFPGLPKYAIDIGISCSSRNSLFFSLAF